MTSDVRYAVFEHAHAICPDPHNGDGWWVGDYTGVRYCDGQSVRLVAGSATESGNADGVARGEDARFAVICGIVCNRDRTRLYISDCDNHKIQTIDLNDESRRVLTVAGNGSTEPAVDGKCREVAIASPTRMVFDRSRSPPSNESDSLDSVLWIASIYLRRFDISAGVITTFLPHVELSVAASIDSTPNGTLVLVNGGLVCSFDPRTLRYDELAGRAAVDDFADGTGDKARFAAPRCAAVIDHERCLYVGDSWNNRIRRVTLPSTFFSLTNNN